MLPTRIWELSLGGLVSLINIDKMRRPLVSSSLAILGMLLVVLSYFIGGEIISYFVLLPTLGAALILLSSSHHNIAGKVLSQKLFVTNGKLSYSIYLWHWVLIVLFKNLEYQLHHINRHSVNALIFILTLLLSYLTYTFVESKTRNYRHTPKIVVFSIAIITGLTLFISCFFSVYYHSNFNKITDNFRYYDISPKQVIPEKGNPIDYNMIMPTRPEKFTEAYKQEGIITRVNDKEPELVLFGDSHGVMWAKLLDEISNELKLSRTFYTSTAAKPFFNLHSINKQSENGCYSSAQKADYAKSFIKNIEKWSPKVIIMACRWEGLNNEDELQLNDLLVFLGKQNVKVVFLNQPPRLSFIGNRNAGQYFAYLGFNTTFGYSYVDLYKNESVIAYNTYLKTLEKKYQFVSVYDVFNKMTQNNKVKIILNNDVLYYDDDHLSYPGTNECKSDLKKLITDNV